ncbi:putative flap endonuclease-1-like 5' DNA nuclease [Rhodoligotrophos appendicifer]|uniref:DUF4332 domain-containing protein n=1 Tax=Rhodoligotrophos appendicifer TaxID=987056 RepID=UPI0011869E51|nr:DUF4332 domain-containing protein [Rhodoligotrophos appendicifer]
MACSITSIEGIDDEVVDKLKQAGIRSLDALLKRAGDRRGRRLLAGETGLPETAILRWTNMADLMRIRGVGDDYAELLRATGVDTVRELRHRNAVRLTAALMQVNAERRLVREAPGEKRVAKWIEQAKLLPVMMTY